MNWQKIKDVLVIVSIWLLTILMVYIVYLKVKFLLNI